MEKEDKIKSKISKATKWSTITELLAKLIVPITNLILARILAPDAFGVIATITTITSFADMLTDAGFQKYIIQHDFQNEEELHQNANVAFLSNFVFSLFLWIIIVIFRDLIVSLLGSPNLGIPLVIASLQLPLTALSSIQMALYKRDLDFKTLFYRRIISVILPFIITIPLALIGFNYRSLIIGTLCGHISNIIILLIKSKWRPTTFFSFNILKKMISFSVWSLMDSIIIWLGSYIDVFIIGNVFDTYYLGLYNNSLHTVNAIMNIITASITPVLLSSLSKYQNDNEKFNSTLFNFQKLMSYIIIPMGVGIFLYKELVVEILLGSEWLEAANIIGIMSLITPFIIVLSNCVSICYIAKGKPKLSLIAQLIYLIPLVPIGIISANKSFWSYVYIRNFYRISLIISNLIILNKILKISSLKLIKNLLLPVISSIIMAIVAIVLQNISKKIIWSIISITLCILTYFIIIVLIDKKSFKLIKELIKKKV